jgi:hypothetical protein
MISFPGRVIRQTANFLGISLDENSIVDIARLTSFERLSLLERNNDRGWQELESVACSEIPFFHKGSSTGWKEVLDPSSISKIERTYCEVMEAFDYPLSHS